MRDALFDGNQTYGVHADPCSHNPLAFRPPPRSAISQVSMSSTDN